MNYGRKKFFNIVVSGHMLTAAAAVKARAFVRDIFHSEQSYILHLMHGLT
jgi:hypothetical protein